MHRAFAVRKFFENSLNRDSVQRMADDGLSHEDRMTLRLLGNVDLDDEAAVESRLVLFYALLTAVVLLVCWQYDLMDYAPAIAISVFMLPLLLLGWAWLKDNREG